MNTKALMITYKIYLEAEDVTQSRIQATSSYVKNLFSNCTNTYFRGVDIDDESDLDEFALRLYAQNTVKEEVCSDNESAKSFIMDMAEFLDYIAKANSFLEMEGMFSIEYEGVKESIKFTSECGQDYCDFE